VFLSGNGISTYYAYKTNFAITSGNTYALTVYDSSFSGTLIVNNNSASYPITALYISTTSLGGGVNQLSTSIAPLGTRQIVGLPSGTYYVRAVRNGSYLDVIGEPIGAHSYTTHNFN
jgi:hypothetical protein